MNDSTPARTSAPPGDCAPSRAFGARHPLFQALFITTIWRIAVGAAGAVGELYLPRGKFSHFSLIGHGGWPRNPLTLALDAGVRNDALWYAGIVQNGYSFSTRHMSSIAFYPLYPLLVKIASVLVGNVFVAGMLISTVCLFGAVILLHAWMEDRNLGDATPATVLCLLLFPWSLFYAAMYSESLYLLLAIGAFLWYERGQWWLSGMCTFLLALDRPTGILIVPALGVLLYRRHERPIGAFVPMATALTGIGMFAVFQWVALGSPVASWQAAAVPPWSRGIHQAFLDITLHARPGFPAWYVAFMLTIGLIALMAIPAVIHRLGPAYALFAALTIILPAASGLTSLERYLITSFPLFVTLSCTVHRRVLVGVLVFGFYCLLFLAGAFAADWAVF
jgi:hypothetical protein